MFALTSPVNDALCPLIVPVVERPPFAFSTPALTTSPPALTVRPPAFTRTPPELTVRPLLAVSILDTVTLLWNNAELATVSFEHVRSLPSYHPTAFARTQGYVATVSPPMVMLPADTLVTLKDAVLVTLRLVKLPVVPDIVAALIVPVLVMLVYVMPVRLAARLVTSAMAWVCEKSVI